MKISAGKLRGFLYCIFPVLIVFCLVFSCKSSPSPAAEKSSSAAEAEAPAIEETLTEDPEIDDAVSVEEQEEEIQDLLHKVVDLLQDPSSMPVEPPPELVSQDEQDQKIQELLHIVVDLLQDPPSMPVEAELVPSELVSADAVSEPVPAPIEQPAPLPAPEPVLPPQQALPQPVPQPAPQPAPQPVPQPSPPTPPAPVQPAPPATVPAPVEPPVQIPVEPEPPRPEEQSEFLIDRPFMDRLVLPGRLTPENPEGEIIFSRIVRASIGQLIEIPFRGTGWVYLGELGNRRGIVYDSRRLDLISGAVEGQSFIFRTEAAGTYILKFYKHDFIQDYIINDHVQIIVGDSDLVMPGRYIDRGRVVADPRWPSPDFVPQSPAPVAAAPAAPIQTAPQTAAPQPAPAREAPQPEPRIIEESPPLVEETIPVTDPADYIRRARQEYDAGRVESALGIMETMQRNLVPETDEALWLLGQLYEANSPVRDIRFSVDIYRRLVREYPQSRYAADAQRRIAYLERYYFNIR